MKVKRTERIWIKQTKTLLELSHIAKNLYNQANYIVREEFIKTGKWIRSYSLDNILKNSENYKLLPAQTSQQILKITERNWKSFYKAIKEWKRNPEKFCGRPKLPKYKKKDGVFSLVFTNQQIRLEDGMLRLPKKVGLEVNTRLENEIDIREVRLIPKGIGYWLEIIYEKQIKPVELDESRVIGIDIGLRNTVTIADNIGEKPIVIKGGVLRSVNQYFNKEKARLQSIYDLQKLRHQSRQLHKLDVKRLNKIRDYMHKTSKWIVEYCKDKNIGTIVIGHNPNWKQKIELGKRNNQNFVSIPFEMLTEQIKYKSEEIGINIVVQDEYHTSKCSFLDNEPLEHREEYLGKRMSRGLFRSSNGTIINADVNGAYNILKKAIPNAFADGIEGVGLHPVRWISNDIVRRGLKQNG